MTIVRILDRGRNTNSYKFALLRALADYGRNEPSGRTLNYEYLAERFVSYYWPLALRFRVRQATSPEQDPAVMRFVRDEARDLDLATTCTVERYKGQHRDRFNALLARCANPHSGCFRDVVPRLHTVGGVQIDSRLYTYAAQGLTLEAGVPAFLRDHHRVIERLAIGAWVQFTERFSTAPRLAEKISGVRPLRRQQGYHDLLLGGKDSQCFYCEHQGSVVDHVIPWSYILEDRVWNLVPCCERCNSQKSDQTPIDQFISKLADRNHWLLAMVEAEQALPRVAHDMREWASRNLDEHVQILVANCRADGFGTWKPTVQLAKPL